MMVGNWAQSILHGGVIASALDVAAGLGLRRQYPYPP